MEITDEEKAQHYLSHIGYYRLSAYMYPLLSIGSPDKPRGLSIQPCKSEKEEPYIRHSSQGRSECLYLRIE